MTILKVQFKDEIRRITLDNDGITLASIHDKIRAMFPLLEDFLLQYRDDDGNLVDIFADEDLKEGIVSANSKSPPIFRVTVVESVPSNTLTWDTPLMMETPLPSDSETQPAESETIISEEPTTFCSVCFSPIEDDTTSYKCLNCFDFILCQECEGAEEHDTQHLLVKLRVPVQSLSLKQQLIFTRYIADSEQKKLASQKKAEILKSIKTKELEMKMKTKEERIRARKERIRRRLQAKKKLDDKAKRVCSKKCTKKKSKGSKCSTSLPVPPVAVAEPVPQKELEEVEFKEIETQPLQDSDVEITPVENVLVSVDAIEEESEDEDETKPEVVEEGGWDLMENFKSLTDTVSTAVSGVATAVLSSGVENHRIQGIAFRQKLEALESMGFADKNKNILLLVKNLANLEGTVSDLVESS